MSEEKDLFGQVISKSHRGGGKSMVRIIGASNHCAESRAEDDFYATPSGAVEQLCDIEKFSERILEPCCGQGHISKVLSARGYSVTSRDIVNRGYGDEHGVDFLKDNRSFEGDVVTNPPYNMAQQFVEHALEIVPDGHKVAMFLKLTFAEGKARRAMFERTPPIRVWVSSSRLGCGKNGTEWNPSAVCYAWWVFEKGFKGHTELRWFN